jgi:periplasmic divalent cation tolerance protein
MPSETARIVLTTTDNEDSAKRIAQALVERHLAACVNLIPKITSIYRWQESVETASEILLVIKTTAERIPSFEAALRELHGYEVPEFLVLNVESGSKPYLDWLYGALKS